MSRWFRHYAGMMRDDKLVRVALKSRQSVERVVWVWGAVLESAAEIDGNGRYEIDVAEIAYFLRADEADISRILESLEGLGRLHAGSVAKWGDRQFQSDRSAERQKRYRDKRAARSDDDVQQAGNVTVTAASRHGDAPEAETETEAYTPTVSNEPVGGRAKAPPEHVQILDCLKSVLSGERAAGVIAHRKKLKKPLTLHAAKLLAGQLMQAAEPDKAADLMISRGWTGFSAEWGANAGLMLASSQSQPGHDPPSGIRISPVADPEAWDAWKRSRGGKSLPTDKEGFWTVTSRLPPTQERQVA